MASINKLSIRGIRAFSPTDQEQVVEFYFPVTIIVGQNGCGKTTIIEALKYAITGAFPPGCGRSGNAFVHDAKCIGQTTVKANVKLRFTSRAGQSMVVVRSMELTQKKTTQTFKQLDGVLRMFDPETGERVSLSHKCTELDKQLPHLLGVSKPILEHVVFCHQEDASWPLMEGAVLKKRFDDIFDSTKYSKALQAFRTTEKEFLAKVKDHKVEVAAFGAHKQAAEGFRKELDEQNEHVNSLDDLRKGIADKIAKVDEVLTSMSDLMSKVERLDNEIESSKNNLNQEQMVVKKQRSMLEKDLTRKHSLRELQDQLRDYQQQITGQLQEEEVLRQQCDKLHQDIETARQAEIGLTSNMGKLSAEKEAHEKNVRERFKTMENIAQTYSIELTQLSQTQGGNSLAASLSQSILADDDDDGSAFISITAEDMQGFFQALEAKEASLRESLKEHKDRFQTEEDVITGFLTELGGKLQAIENDKLRLANERKEAERELKELKDVGGPRVRKADVEEAKRNAKRMADERDELNRNPRRQQIHLDIRMIEDNVDKLKRKIEDESNVLNSLRHTAEAQNSIRTLQEQCEKDFDSIEESIRDESYCFSKFGIAAPSTLPKENDTDGELLVKAIEDMSVATRKKYDALDGDLNRLKEVILNNQKTSAEKSALLSGNQKSLGTVKSKLSTLSTSVSDVQTIVEQLRRHEAEQGASLTTSEETPRELLRHIDKRLAEIEEDAPVLNESKIAKKIRLRVARMAIVDANNKLFSCPCCKRGMSLAETEIFHETLQDVFDKAQTEDNAREYNARKHMYETMRKSVEDKIDDLRDFRRLTGEADELEREIKRLTDIVVQCNTDLKERSAKRDEAQAEVDELRAVLDMIRRWSDDAVRIAEKKLQAQQKQRDLNATLTDSSRDLKTVDRQIVELREEKEGLANKIVRLNKEMSDFNHRISEVSSQALNSDKLAREREEKFSNESKATDRRNDLNSRTAQITVDEGKLSEQIALILAKIKKKEQEKHRLRSLANEGERDLQTTLIAFDGALKNLHTLTQQIEVYLRSDKPQELARISTEVQNVLRSTEYSRTELRRLDPMLESAKRGIDDQERYKILLKQNMEVLEAEKRMKDTENEIADLESRRSDIEGHDSVCYDYQAAKESKEELQQRKANYDGRFSSHVEQIHALKRKLSSADYKHVDDEYRVALIKMSTTKVAAEDLKRYGNALDKALLQFHGVKIREINKIIKELWLMTYKGEDITDIEIQSGQEPGSKAAKSYNYRVVFRKGGAQMDMRGRCSAGQRVLTSIVIRLALAETFGVNCGVVALDEPTVNLDYDNKKGLAVALAHIVASRSQQRNFQLILITHDEEFVAMMKTELSSLTGFSMPEKYFQVCREESPDGKYYSKIHAIDWDELV